MNQPTSLEREPALILDGITRNYGQRTVLSDLSFVREKPGIIGVLGENGSGKTTLLRIIAQLLEPDTGALSICKIKVERGDCAEARKLVGWVPHQPLAWRDDSVFYNLSYAAQLAGEKRGEAKRLAERSVSTWALEAVEGQSVRSLSRGWQQRYALARADLFHPPLLLLDEPTTGLDANARALLEAALERWSKSRIVLVSSHEREWLLSLADETIDLGETK